MPAQRVGCRADCRSGSITEGSRTRIANEFLGVVRAVLLGTAAS
jgi:hypothetical protein